MRIVPSSLDHARFGTLLRAEDLREIHAVDPGRDPCAVVAFNIAASQRAYTMFDKDGSFVCIGGVAPQGDGAGSVWLHGSPLMKRYRVALARRTPEYINLLHEEYRLLTNYVDPRNEVHVEWLRYAGFRFTRPVPGYAKDGTTFVEFFKVKECVNQQP